jgi:hypothetical protein
MMRKCAGYKKLIHEYIDNDLCDSKRIEVEDHIDSCNECKEYFNSIKNLVVSLNSMKTEYQIDIKAKVMSDIGKKTARIIDFRKYYKYCATAACLAIAITVFFTTGGFNRMLRTDSVNGLSAETALTGDGSYASDAELDRYYVAPKGQEMCSSVEESVSVYYNSSSNIDTVINDLNNAIDEYGINCISRSDDDINVLKVEIESIYIDKLVDHLSLVQDQIYMARNNEVRSEANVNIVMIITCIE